MSQQIAPSDIIDFWFSERVKPLWFKKSSEFDREIEQRFLDAYQLAKTGSLDNWRNDSYSTLALIIVLDQFPRNMFRDTSQAFATDGKAVELTKYAVAHNYQQDLSTEQQAFLYMPLMHSENRIDQTQCVELFTKLGKADNLKFAIEHHKIIDRFGRFLMQSLQVGEPAQRAASLPSPQPNFRQRIYPRRTRIFNSARFELLTTNIAIFSRSGFLK